jgi:hypothetical protein
MMARYQCAGCKATFPTFDDWEAHAVDCVALRTARNEKRRDEYPKIYKVKT